MTSKLLLASFAAATLGVSAAALPASAQQGVSPVSVVGCAVNVQENGAYNEGASPTFSSGDLSISFVNNGDRPATAVEFAVHAGGQTQTIVAQGSFAPGTEITNDFVPTVAAPTSCDVEAVTFSDGTTWHA
ncbi:MAG TPA: hypothetical protein VMD91_11210 [Candidatus Sulfotelmatobacter sp.]|nr:hypothetical protein [Candidatus Sulfotelmatobacter sp.]